MHADLFRKLCLAGGLIVSLSAHASRADDAVIALTKELNNLNCLVESQRERGYPLALRADDLVDKFANAKKQTPERFRAIVQLVAAALPCGVESESAGTVAELRDENGWRKAFDEALLTIPACKVKNLIAAIKERQDDAADRTKSKAPKQPIFSYAACVTGRDPQGIKKK